MSVDSRPSGGGVTEILKPKTDEIRKLKEQLFAAQLQTQNKEQEILQLQRQLLESEKENEELESLHAHFQQHIELALTQIQQYRHPTGQRRPRRRPRNKQSDGASVEGSVQAEQSSKTIRRLRRQSTREKLRKEAVSVEAEGDLSTDSGRRQEPKVVNSSKVCLVM